MITRTDRRAYLRFPWTVLASDPAWVPPLLIDQASRFKRSFPFYEHGDVMSWLARSADGKPVGRISGIVNRLHNEFHRDKVGFFGFFDSVNDATVAGRLLDAASAWLRQQGMTSIRGPMDFSVNEECGMLLDGFDTPPAIMMLHNPRYYNDLMAANGMSKAKDLLGYEMSTGQLSERMKTLAPKLAQRLKVRIRPFNAKDFWGEVKRVEELYNQSWEANWGFVPMTAKELKLMAQTLKLVYDPRIIHFAENEQGKVVGFSLALPDTNVIFKGLNGRLLPTGIFKIMANRRKLSRLRLLLLGVLPGYRKRGIDVLLYYYAHEDGIRAGYNWGEFSWILEDNFEMNEALVAMGATCYKTWRIWEKAI